MLIEVNSTRHIEDGFYLSQQESSTAELMQNNSSPLFSLLLYSIPNDFSPPYPITTTTPDQHFVPHLGPTSLCHQCNPRHKDHKKLPPSLISDAQTWLPESSPLSGSVFSVHPPKVNILFPEMAEKAGPEGPQPKLMNFYRRKVPRLCSDRSKVCSSARQLQCRFSDFCYRAATAKYVPLNNNT